MKTFACFLVAIILLGNGATSTLRLLGILQDLKNNLNTHLRNNDILWKRTDHSYTPEYTPNTGVAHLPQNLPSGNQQEFGQMSMNPKEIGQHQQQQQHLTADKNKKNYNNNNIHHGYPQQYLPNEKPKRNEDGTGIIDIRMGQK